MNEIELKKILDEHKLWLNGNGGQQANLSGANLSWADLRGADLDYSCWPLWCGSKNVKVDLKIAQQIAAHFCALDCKDKEYKAARKAILNFAQKSHRAKDLEIIK